MKAEVIRNGIFSMQVCVPGDFTDEQITNFANTENPCGTKRGWAVRKEGHELIAGDAERVKCSLIDNCVHVMLDA